MARSRIATVLLAAALALLAVAPSAMGSALTRTRTASFGSDGTAATSFGHPGRLAFNQANDKLYVFDGGAPTARIHAFNTPALTPAGGAFPLTVGEGGENSGIGVDNTLGSSANNVYYVTNLQRKVYGFNSTGTALGGSFPIDLSEAAVPCGAPGVDSAGNLYVADFGSRNIRKYDSAGSSLTTISTLNQGQPCNVAFDSNNDMFVGIYQGFVYKYTAASGYHSATIVGATTDTRGITVDTTANILYVATKSKVSAYNATTGALLYEFAGGTPGATFNGVAVDQGTDQVYVSDEANNKVYVFGAAQSYADATGTTTPATNISYFSADLNGTIDDNNAQQTTWRLEISSDNGQAWSMVKTGQTAGGQSGVAVSATATGLSLNTDYKFRLVTNKGSSPATEVPSSMLAFKTLNTPNATATPSAATNLAETSADLHATIDDNGPLPTNWRIELTADGGTTWSEIDSGQTAGGQSGATVTATATELVPNSDYSFRIITNKGPGSPEVNGGSLDFSTPAVPPAIEDADVGAREVNDTSARLVATIDPRHSQTSYRFEYGTTPGADEFATNPVDIGAGIAPVTVSQLVSGLGKDTDYYFKVEATNPAGTTTVAKTFHTRALPFPPANPSSCPNEAIRAAQGSTYLPDCRAYEMVTPSDKNQGGVGGRGASPSEWISAGFSRDGSAVAFCAGTLFGEPVGQMSDTCAQYVSRRGPTGWSTIDPLPHFCASDAATGSAGISVATRSVLLSPESFDRYAMSTPEFADCPAFPLVPGAPADSTNLYRGDLRTDPTGFNLLSPEKSTTISAVKVGPVGGSADFSHVVYATYTNQTADSPPQGDYFKLYDWAEPGSDCSSADPTFRASLGGCLSLVSKDPGGGAIAANSVLPMHVAAALPIPGAVSENGKRIFFESGPPSTTTEEGYGECQQAGCDLYLREDDTTTIKVSESECTSECGTGTGPANLLWASPAGDVVLFDSCAKLTDASAGADSCPTSVNVHTTANLQKIYRWQRGAAPGSRLVDVSVDHEPADGEQPKALGIIGASSEQSADPGDNAAPGNTVYFVAAGQIVAGAPTGTVEGTALKLYRWRWNGGSPSVDYLGPYLSARASGRADLNADRLESDPNAELNHVRVTPDGRYLAIQSKLPLDPVVDRDADADMYRWDEEDGWQCVSCQLPGAPSAGNVSSYLPYLNHNLVFTDLWANVAEHTISDDGQRIFFSTPDALLPRDVNGEAGCPVSSNLGGGNFFLSYACADVYEWHDGTLSLLSSGTGAKPFVLLGATHDGSEVFFATAQRMVGWDLDNAIDIYAAPTDGGFPEPPPAPAACASADECHGRSTVATQAPGAGSAAFEGPGNQKAKSKKHHRKHKHKAKHRKRHAKHNRRAGR